MDPESRFLYYFCLMIEGSGSVPLTNPDPDPGDPKTYGSGSESGSARLLSRTDLAAGGGGGGRSGGQSQEDGLLLLVLVHRQELFLKNRNIQSPNF
jgi:hypothetical protein